VIVDPGSPGLRATKVQIDVKPTINLTNEGSIAVTLLTTADFDAWSVDISSVRFGFAQAYSYERKDMDNDGDLDLVLYFRTQDTNLRALYEQLLAEDMDGDGILDSTRQTATVSLIGETLDGELFQGDDDVSLFLSGKSLRQLLDELFGS
jgi:hypothetical protein